MDTMTITTPADVLTFWFGQLEPDADAAPHQKALWFRKSDETDATIRERFGSALTAARAGSLAGWESDARSWLALVVVLDQFSRNLYRDDARAFASDAQTRDIVRRGLDQGLEGSLHAMERVFIYLPFEHAEDLDTQGEAVRGLTSLVSECSPAQRESCQAFLDYAHRHRDVIARFGRFPHRNAVLGRETTPVERDYLDAGGGF